MSRRLAAIATLATLFASFHPVSVNAQSVNYFEAQLSCQTITDSISVVKTTSRGSSLVISCIDECATRNMTRVALRPTDSDNPSTIDCGCFDEPLGVNTTTPQGCNSVKCADGNPCGSKTDSDIYALYVIDLDSDWLSTHNQLLADGAVETVPKSNTGKIVGIVVGVICGILLLIVAFILCMRARRRSKERRAQEQRETDIENDHVFNGRGNQAVIADDNVFDFTKGGDEKATAPNMHWVALAGSQRQGPSDGVSEISDLSVESVITGSNAGSMGNHKMTAAERQELDFFEHQQELIRQQENLRMQQQAYGIQQFDANSRPLSMGSTPGTTNSAIMPILPPQMPTIHESFEMSQESDPFAAPSIAAYQHAPAGYQTSSTTNMSGQSGSDIIGDPSVYDFEDTTATNIRHSQHTSMMPSSDMSMRDHLQRLLDEDAVRGAGLTSSTQMHGMSHPHVSEQFLAPYPMDPSSVAYNNNNSYDKSYSPDYSLSPYTGK